MNRVRIIRLIRLNMIRYSMVGLIVCLLGTGAAAMIKINSSSSSVSQQSRPQQHEKTVSEKSAKDEPETASPLPTEANQETSKPSEQSTPSKPSVTTPKPSTPTKQTPSYPAPSTQEFGISFIYLSSPAVFCSGGGDYYIAQIGDVIISLRGTSGGKITYGFEVTGGISDDSKGYRQPATVPAGVYSTSFNKLYWGDTTDPHMAYSRVIYSGHGPAAVRAVVYTPTVAYSPWVSIPAQQSGEKCS